MPKLPKYEDWRWPWTQGDVDEDKLARLVYNLKKDVEDAGEKLDAEKAKVSDLQTELDDEKARKSGTDEDVQQELKDLRKENRTLKEGQGQPDPSHQAEIGRLNDIVDLVDKGLPKALAMRVQGDDSEARLEDAKALAEVAGIDFGGDSDGVDPGDPAQQGGPPVQTPTPRHRTGFENGSVPTTSNPTKAAESLPPLFA